MHIVFNPQGMAQYWMNLVSHSTLQCFLGR